MSSPDPVVTDAAMDRILSAAQWLTDARARMGEPNGRGAAAACMNHARQRLLEAVALIDSRPASLRAVINHKEELRA